MSAHHQEKANRGPDTVGPSVCTHILSPVLTAGLQQAYSICAAPHCTALQAAAARTTTRPVLCLFSHSPAASCVLLLFLAVDRQESCAPPKYPCLQTHCRFPVFTNSSPPNTHHSMHVSCQHACGMQKPRLESRMPRVRAPTIAHRPSNSDLAIPQRPEMHGPPAHGLDALRTQRSINMTTVSITHTR